MAFEHYTFYVFEWQIGWLLSTKLIKTLKMLNLYHILENTKRRFFSVQRKLAKILHHLVSEM